MAIVTLRYWAAAREAAGVAEETITAETLAEALAAARGKPEDSGHCGPAGQGSPGGAGSRSPGGPGGPDSPGDPGSRNRGGPGPGGQGSPEGPGSQGSPGGVPGSRLRSVLARSSFLIDGVPVGTRAPEAVVLRDSAVIEVLPPFAGG